MSTIAIARFRLGLITVWPRVLEAISQEDITNAIQRHQAGDWGDVSETERNENEISLKEGGSVFSVYHSSEGIKFGVVTEGDRRSTTVLLAGEY